MRHDDQPGTLHLQPAQALAGARSWVTHHGTELGFDKSTLDQATLLTSEMITNARKHGSPQVPLTVRLEGAKPDLLRIAVTDVGHRMPRLLRPPASSAGGRGMWLVHHCAAAWGVKPQAFGQGKTVWFQLGRGTLQPLPGADPEAALTVVDGTARLELQGKVTSPGQVSGLLALGAGTRLPLHVDCRAVSELDPVVIAALTDLFRHHVRTPCVLHAPPAVRATLDRAGLSRYLTFAAHAGVFAQRR